MSIRFSWFHSTGRSTLHGDNEGDPTYSNETCQEMSEKQGGHSGCDCCCSGICAVWAIRLDLIDKPYKRRSRVYDGRPKSIHPFVNLTSQRDVVWVGCHWIFSSMFFTLVPQAMADLWRSAITSPVRSAISPRTVSVSGPLEALPGLPHVVLA
jgi:hypothetical protein